jgi:hypothetical protein
MSNLEEIRTKLQPFEARLRDLGFGLSRAFENVDNEPSTTCTNCGKVVERVLCKVCEKEELDPGDENKRTIENLLNRINGGLRAAKKVPLPKRVQDKIGSIRMTRNRATHDLPPEDQPTPSDAVETLGQLSVVVDWFFNAYLRGENLPAEPAKLRPEQVSVSSLVDPQPVAATPSPSAIQFALLYKRHSEPDEQVLSFLESRLKAAGHTVFIDRHLTIGIEWAKEIERQVRTANVVIPLLSPSSVRSEMMAYEIHAAHDASQSQGGKPRLLPVRINYLGQLPDEIGIALNRLHYFLWTGPEDNESLLENIKRALLNPTDADSSLTAYDPLTKPALEQEGGMVPPDSPFYVLRPIDNEFYEAIERRDNILLLKGARQMGKSTVLGRALGKANDSGFRVVVTDFQTLNNSDLQSIESFYIALGNKIAVELELQRFPADTWRKHLNANGNFEWYVEREVLASSTKPLIWAMDEVDRLFTCSFGTEVFALLRAWHEKRTRERKDGLWKRLTFAVVYATEASLFIKDLNQSPFNVGTRFQLHDFSLEQVADLNVRYGSPLRSAAELSQFFDLIGGHPYLTRRGLRQMVDRKIDIRVFLAQADRDEGLFGDHLRRMIFLLAQDEDLTAALKGVLRGQPCDYGSFHRLQSGGVLKGESAAQAAPRCQLYATYLQRHLF